MPDGHGFPDAGFVVERGLFDSEEVALLQRVTAAELGGIDEGWARRDASGRPTQLSVRNELGDDLFSAVARSPRVVGRMTQLLGGEVYHWHHKLMVKAGGGGGAWEWHQDYGYWYEDGCLRPLLASCVVAISSHTRENGCLEVLAGSHGLGRLDHGRRGDQTAANPDRVEAARARFEHRYVELEPGDALLFHCNLLHRSGANRTDAPRLSLICCYNAARNDPYVLGRHPAYSPLATVEDGALVAVGRTQLGERV